ncbi:MAG TPA: nucleotidyl transferase AbiEii/AbiGii toxin family protein [Burkholderiales bacterium]|nr:nucleotidyl transferase AbiEii/AbiGii toxin family protein [Burkholderiales bacterium]
MAEDRLAIWETLFKRALALIDSAGVNFEPWSFGGGTVLMRRHRHRFSKDIDIFVPDPQYLGYVSPKLNETAGSMTGDYVEENASLKLVFREGEIDFIASAPLTSNPTVVETLFDRAIHVETSTEIIAKKVWHRGSQFKARDMFDLALVAEREPDALDAIRPVLRDRKDAVLARIAEGDKQLRSDFAELEALEFRPSYDECLKIVKRVFRLK